VTYLLLVLAGFASWTISTLSGGGGSIFLIAVLGSVVRVETAAPIASLASLMAAPARIAFSWRLIDWRLISWYLPGAVVGAVLGAWSLTRLDERWVTPLVALFLISTAWQYRLGARASSFRMRLPWFIPVSVVVAFISGLIGASALVANPFYLNYGLVKERMLATRAVNSLAIQLAKLGTYASFGALGGEAARGGLAAGLGAVLAILIVTPWLQRLSEVRFRRLAILVMVGGGLILLWREAQLLR
jgi:uncharacterized membrane protein YfcA